MNLEDSSTIIIILSKDFLVASFTSGDKVVQVKLGNICNLQLNTFSITQRSLGNIMEIFFFPQLPNKTLNHLQAKSQGTKLKNDQKNHSEITFPKLQLNKQNITFLLINQRMDNHSYNLLEELQGLFRNKDKKKSLNQRGILNRSRQSILVLC